MSRKMQWSLTQQCSSYALFALSEGDSAFSTKHTGFVCIYAHTPAELCLQILLMAAPMVLCFVQWRGTNSPLVRTNRRDFVVPKQTLAVLHVKRQPTHHNRAEICGRAGWVTGTQPGTQGLRGFWKKKRKKIKKWLTDMIEKGPCVFTFFFICRGEVTTSATEFQHVPSWSVIT